MPSRYWSINPSSPLVSGLELAGSDLVNSSHEQGVSEVKKKLRFKRYQVHQNKCGSGYENIKYLDEEIELDTFK